MTNQFSDPVTPEANPDENQGGAPAAVETLPDPTTVPAAPQPPVPGPDAAYKGLQRELAKRDQKLRELEARLSQATSGTHDAESEQVIGGLLSELGKTNPERAAILQAGYQQWKLAKENEQLRNRAEGQEQERAWAEAAQRNEEELRGIVESMGVDPDDSSIDYGQPDEWLAERIRKVRASATAAKRSQSVTPPTRNAADGTAHSTQPGTPPPPPPRGAAPVTDEELAKAQREYALAYQGMNGEKRAAANDKLRDLTNRYAAQVFSG